MIGVYNVGSRGGRRKIQALIYEVHSTTKGILSYGYFKNMPFSYDICIYVHQRRGKKLVKLTFFARLPPSANEYDDYNDEEEGDNARRDHSHDNDNIRVAHALEQSDT